jgi:hypothetical protein
MTLGDCRRHTIPWDMFTPMNGVQVRSVGSPAAGVYVSRKEITGSCRWQEVFATTKPTSDNVVIWSASSFYLVSFPRN